MNNKRNTRMCVICRSRKDKSELLKIVPDENLGAKIDENQKENKRGVYICNEEKCIEKLIKSKNIDSVLRTSFLDSNKKEIFINDILKKLKKGVN